MQTQSYYREPIPVLEPSIQIVDEYVNEINRRASGDQRTRSDAIYQWVN